MRQKISIIGYSGSGKSTLAKKLGQICECDVLHLDCVHWLPGWQERDSAGSCTLAAKFLDTHDSWVIDGNYQKILYERRMQEATQIIFLDFPMPICLFRVLKRYLGYRGKSRESITEGCEEKIDGEFFWWILHKGRDKAHRKNYRRICKKYSRKAVILRSPTAVKKYLERFSQAGSSHHA